RGKAGGACGPLRLNDANAVAPFPLKSITDRQALLQIDRPTVRSHALLRKARNLLCHFLRRFSRLALRHDLLTKTDPQALFGLDLPRRNDDQKTPPVADDAGTPPRPPAKERPPPAPEIPPNIAFPAHPPAVSPESKPHAPRNRRSLDRRDNGLGEF